MLGNDEVVKALSTAVDPKTGKIKDELTEMVDINKGKKDIFGNPKKPHNERQKPLYKVQVSTELKS